MKEIYTAPNREAAGLALERLEEKWVNKYGYAIKSWKDNWEELTAFLDFPLEIRKIIYTTNIIENLNGKIRKIHKKQAFLSNRRGCHEVRFPCCERSYQKMEYAYPGLGNDP